MPQARTLKYLLRVPPLDTLYMQRDLWLPRLCPASLAYMYEALPPGTRNRQYSVQVLPLDIRNLQYKL